MRWGVLGYRGWVSGLDGCIYTEWGGRSIEVSVYRSGAAIQIGQQNPSRLPSHPHPYSLSLYFPPCLIISSHHLSLFHLLFSCFYSACMLQSFSLTDCISTFAFCTFFYALINTALSGRRAVCVCIYEFVYVFFTLKGVVVIIKLKNLYIFNILVLLKRELFLNRCFPPNKRLPTINTFSERSFSHVVESFPAEFLGCAPCSTSPHPPICSGPVSPGALRRQPSLPPPPLWTLLAEVLCSRAWDWGLWVQRTLMPSDSTGQSKGQAASVNSWAEGRSTAQLTQCFFRQCVC